MLLAGLSSILSRGKRSAESKKIEYARPIQNLPAGICAMPSGTAVCAAIGNAAQTQQRRVDRILLFIPLCEQFPDFGQGNKRLTSEGGRLLVFIGSPGRRVHDFLGPIDAQRRIDRRNDVIHHWLFFVIPTHIEHLVAVRLTDNPSRLDASAHKQIRETGAPMIAPGVGVHLRIAPEFVHQATERRIKPGAALVYGKYRALWS